MTGRTSIIRQQYVRQFRETGIISCGLCGYGIAFEEEITVDHIIPLSKGGSSRVENLQPAHSVCNGIKANSQPKTWINPHGKKEEHEEKRLDNITNPSSVRHRTSDLAFDPNSYVVHRGSRHGSLPHQHKYGRHTANRGYNYRKITARKQRRSFPEDDKDY